MIIISVTYAFKDFEEENQNLNDIYTSPTLKLSTNNKTSSVNYLQDQDNS